jgi:hypothetical protein
MVEPFSLTAVGVLALTEGVKFLYAQAGELLKYRRDRKQAPELRPPAGALAGSVEPVPPDDERLERLETEVREGRKALSDYVDGVDPIDPADPELGRRVDDLRRALEAIYGQRITFKGETREPSGPLVENEVRAAEAEILRSRVGVVRNAPAGSTVVQSVGAEHATITDSDVGAVTFGPSEDES